MADTIREQVCQEILSRLQAAALPGQDLEGVTIHRNRVLGRVSPSDTKIINVIDGDQELYEHEPDRVVWEMAIMLDILAYAGSDEFPGQLVNEIQGNAIKALTATDATLGGLLDDTIDEISLELEPEFTDGERQATATYTLSVRFAHLHRDPFNQ